jgi:hypothetical protein
MRYLVPAAALLALALPALAKPAKVYILAGQSNMEGHAKIETFEHIGDDPATAPLLKKMRAADGSPRVCDGAWISLFTGQGDNNGEGFGKLTAGYGSRRAADQPNGKIGPEFTFGITMDEAHAEPVLLIKTAWGGKSLHTDFRPPSAAAQPDAGKYYRLMLEHIRRVLADPKRVCPEADGVELAGFVWFQGWNDMVDRKVYPDVKEGNPYAKYTECLTALIRDVRKDLQAPKLPFVIGVMGVGGEKAHARMAAFREAMAAPAKLPEFRGNVHVTQTAPFWSEELGAIDEKRGQVRQMSHFLNSKHKNHPNKDGTMTEEQKKAHMKEYEAKLISPAEEALWKRGASNAGYHYLGCAKTFAQMGQAFAEALLPPRRETREVSGWKVHIQNKLLREEPAATEKAVGLLRVMLEEVIRVVPSPAVAEMRKVPLYFSPAYQGKGGAEFHPDADWLVANGRDPAMAHCVEFSNISNFEAEVDRMPNFALHELAHAYHFRHLRNGYVNAEVIGAYQKAKAAKSYDSVPRRPGAGKPEVPGERAYAMTNPMEYFAETTEAYFSRNDFFPYNNEELRKHDPGMFALLGKLWGAVSDK